VTEPDLSGIAPDLRDFAVPVDDLVHLEGNPRRGDVDAVARSYARFGQRKPIVARRREDGTSEVIDGNHQLAAARSLGWSHIAVVWTDDDDSTAKAYALAANRTAELGGYDDDALAEMVLAVAAEDDRTLIAATGWDLDELAAITAQDDPTTPDGDNAYTGKIEAPHYEIVGDKPPVDSLYDLSRYESLVEEIDASSIDEDLKVFLRLAASRHVVFDYGRVAEFYPHQDEAVQGLMERSALVIVDFDDAIRLGYVRLQAQIEELRGRDDER
jgi:hypothetical protein